MLSLLYNFTMGTEQNYPWGKCFEFESETFIPVGLRNDAVELENLLFWVKIDTGNGDKSPSLLAQAYPSQSLEFQQNHVSFTKTPIKVFKLKNMACH